jgi:hypothetical protein
MTRANLDVVECDELADDLGTEPTAGSDHEDAANHLYARPCTTAHEVSDEAHNGQDDEDVDRAGRDMEDRETEDPRDGEQDGKDEQHTRGVCIRLAKLSGARQPRTTERAVSRQLRAGARRPEIPDV